RVRLAAAVHLHIQTFGQGIHHRGAHPVQPSGGGVGAVAELAAGVQLGEDHLHPGDVQVGDVVHRDTAPVVAHLHRLIGAQDHLDGVGVPAQCLIDGVVDDLPQAVHEAAGVGGAD